MTNCQTAENLISCSAPQLGLLRVLGKLFLDCTEGGGCFLNKFADNFGEVSPPLVTTVAQRVPPHARIHAAASRVALDLAVQRHYRGVKTSPCTTDRPTESIRWHAFFLLGFCCPLLPYLQLPFIFCRLLALDPNLWQVGTSYMFPINDDPSCQPRLDRHPGGERISVSLAINKVRHLAVHIAGTRVSSNSGPTTFLLQATLTCIAAEQSEKMSSKESINSPQILDT